MTPLAFIEPAAPGAAVLLVVLALAALIWLLLRQQAPRRQVVELYARSRAAEPAGGEDLVWRGIAASSGITSAGAPTAQRSEDELRRRVEIMDRLGQLVVGARDSSDVREQIVLAFVDGVACKRGSLWELSPDGDYFVAQSEVRTSDDPGGSLLGRHVTLPGDPLLAKLSGRAAPLLVEQDRDQALSELLGERALQTYHPRSLMIVPMQQFNRLIGFLMLDSPEQRETFDAGDVELAGSAANYASLVLENLRSRIADQERGGRMTALARLAATLTTRHRMDEVLPEIVNQGQALARSATCTVLLVEDDETLRLAAQVGLGTLERDLRLPLSNPTVASFIRRDAPLLVEDIDRDMPQLRNLLVREDLQAVQVFPLRVSHNVIGVLTLAYTRPFRPDRSQLNLAETLASVAAGAIHNARAFELEIEQRNLLRTVAEISRRVSGILDAEWVLQEVCNLLGRELGYDSVHAFLVEEEGAELGYAAGTGAVGRAIAESGLSLPVDDRTVVGRAVRSAAVRREDVPSGATFRAPQAGLDDPGSELALPIVAHNQVIGVLAVQSMQSNAFDTEDERLLKIVADQVSVALDNARHHEEVQAQARLDSLTQVLNHGAFVNRLHALVERCREEETPLSLIMLDVDEFKLYNDQFGHVAGDAALKTTVQAISANVKSRDAIGRWGGEEFGIALIGADKQQAIGVAERIRQTLRSLVPVDRLGREMPSPRVSQGVAMLDVDAHDADELVDVADQALYRAKDAGRDQVRAAGED